ncbi:MAG: hypothetical protein JO154_13065 [Chitinophaga sp.]|uniref:hypothetical protein n=1 Tax=Chitinophaga sp. TaxID=1869181 RepID=UPI0025BFB1FF|nr:hypothetical protein [Chitinophaga sp.]MBV8253530.1 hypothetical protein [Chitinophaga sp.]
MDKNQVIFILTVWGAALSTVLGVITFITFRKGSRVKLGIIGTVDEPFDHLRISVCNLGTRPGTVTGYSIGVGVSKNTQVQILKRQLNTEKKLAESDIWTTTIDSPTILSAKSELNIKQIYFQRIWINIFLSSGKILSNVAFINPKIINTDHYDRAEQFIATDIFLGFSQMESLVYPIGNK